MQDQPTEARSVLALAGRDRVDFLQNLVSNDVAKLSEGLVYTALLSPQGKYLADFFLVPDPAPENARILIDVATPLADALFRRLSMYKLRADVTLEKTDLAVTRGLGPRPDGAFDDPRDAALGWRAYGQERPSDAVDWDALRVAHLIPESGIELIPDATFILEAGFERLGGVDFRKGCYVGQEVTARMKHKTELRKGLRQVEISGSAPVGSEILSEGKPAGTLFTQADGKAIAYLRFDRIGDDMKAGDATITAR